MQDETNAKQLKKMEMLYSSEMASVTTKVEEQLENFQGSLLALQQQQNHQLAQQQQYSRAQQEAQSMINQNILALQDDINNTQAKSLRLPSTCPNPSLDTPRLEQRIDALSSDATAKWQRYEDDIEQLKAALSCIKNAAERREGETISLGREIRNRATSAEEICADLAAESIRRAESQVTLCISKRVPY